VPAAPESAAPRVREVSGCAQSVVPGTVVLTPQIGGSRRVVRLYVPRGYRAEHPVPLLLDLHGTGSSAARQETLSRMDGTADEHTVLVAYPQGARTTKTGFGWNVPGVPDPPGVAPRSGPDDVAFLGQVVTLLRKHYCVNATEVYATGFSGGGRMISSLACAVTSPLAAIAAVSGLRMPLPCKVARPVPVIAVHGTADLTDPYSGHGASYWTYSVPTAASRWADHDGCAPQLTTSHPYPAVTLTAYRDCRGGAAVRLYTLAGGKHTWPPAPPVAKAGTNEVSAGHPAPFDVNELIWSFLAAHPRS
jgi:polyhydroxybutyrate depolymerase